MPGHTGDFTFLRATRTGRVGAEYSPNTVPLKQKILRSHRASRRRFVFVLGYSRGTTVIANRSRSEYARDANFPFGQVARRPPMLVE